MSEPIFKVLTVALPNKTNPDEIRKKGLEVEFVGTTENLDRDNDRVLGGLDYDAYLKNPIVLWMHDKSFPAGVTTELRRGPNGQTIFKISIPPASVSEKANEIGRMIGFPMLFAVSIGFIPKEAARNEEGGRDFLSPELTEISIVTVPSNRSAVTTDFAEVKSLNGKRIEKINGLESKADELGDEMSLEHIENIMNKLEEVEAVNKALASILVDLSATQTLILEKLADDEIKKSEESEEPEEVEEDEDPKEPEAPEADEDEKEISEDEQEGEESEDEEPESEDDEEEKMAVITQLEKLVGDFAEMKQYLKGVK